MINNGMDNTLPTANVPTTATRFPSIGSLFIQSWELFVSRLGRLALFTLISGFFNFLFIFIIVLILIFVAIISNFGSSPAGHAAATPVFLSIFVLTGIVVIVVCSIIISALSDAWTILALNEAKTTSFGSIFKKGFGLIIPLSFISVISLFVSLGGLSFFILPAFIFAYLFLFVSYEVVCDNQRGINAFKRSYAIATHNFGEVFIRIIIICVISFAFSIVGDLIIHQIPTFAFIWVFISILVSWYQLCYSFTLYQQARVHTDLNKPVSLLWVWVISAVGWIIFLLLMFFLINLSTQLVKSGELQKIIQSYEKQNKMAPIW